MLELLANVNLDRCVLPAVTVVVMSIVRWYIEPYCTLSCGLKVLIAVHVTAVYFRICHDL